MGCVNLTGSLGLDLFRYILDETGNSDPRFLLYLVLFTAFAIFPVYLRILRHFVEVRSSVNIGTSDLKELRKELVSELKLQGATSIQKSSKVEIDLRNHQKSPSEQNFARLVENFIKQKTQTSISNWLDALTKSRETLENEIERLRSRSTTNLTIGLAITGISATVLVMALILPPKTIGEHSWMSIAEVYFPRAALVILLQISSAFFSKTPR